MYHNTTNQSGATLTDYREKADGQEAKILALFRAWSELTPSDVHRLFQLATDHAPITSIRRGITDLAKNKVSVYGHIIRPAMIEKLPDTRIGIYGRPEHIYRLKQTPNGLR